MILNPYVWLGGLLILVLGIGAGYISGRHDGVKITSEKYQAQQIASDRQAADALAAANKCAADVEHASQTAMAEASQTYQEELQNVQIRKDKIIADLRAGAIRLRDPGTGYALSPNTVPATGTGAGGCDGGEKGGFSSTTSEFLVGLASDADAVAQQLSACQAVIRADRQQ